MRRIVEQNEKRLVDYYKSKDFEGFKERFNAIKFNKYFDVYIDGFDDVQRVSNQVIVGYKNQENIQLGKELNECGYQVGNVKVIGATVDMDDIVKGYNMEFRDCKVRGLTSKITNTMLLPSEVKFGKCDIIGGLIMSEKGILIKNSKIINIDEIISKDVAISHTDFSGKFTIGKAKVKLLGNVGVFAYDRDAYGIGESGYIYYGFKEVEVWSLTNKGDSHSFEKIPLVEFDGNFQKIYVERCGNVMGRNAYIDTFEVGEIDFHAIDGRVRVLKGEQKGAITGGYEIQK